MAELPYHCPISMLLAAASTGSDETRENTPDASTTSPTQLEVPFDDLMAQEANGRYSPGRYSPNSRSPQNFLDPAEYAFPLSNHSYHHQILQHQQQQQQLHHQQQQLQMMHHPGAMLGLHQLQQSHLAANAHLHAQLMPHQILAANPHLGMHMQHQFMSHMPEHLQAGSPPKKMRKRSEPDATMEYHSTEDGRGYTCDFKGCGRRFERLHNLKSHYTTHTGERPYPCDACDKAFGRSHDLRRHQRIHTDSKPYACHSCGKRFARNDALTRHQRANGNGGCRTRNRKSRGVKSEPGDEDDDDEEEEGIENAFSHNAVHSSMMHIPHSSVADPLTYDHLGEEVVHREISY